MCSHLLGEGKEVVVEKKEEREINGRVFGSCDELSSSWLGAPPRPCFFHTLRQTTRPRRLTARPRLWRPTKCAGTVVGEKTSRSASYVLRRNWRKASDDSENHWQETATVTTTCDIRSQFHVSVLGSRAVGSGSDFVRSVFVSLKLDRRKDIRVVDLCCAAGGLEAAVGSDGASQNKKTIHKNRRTTVATW